MSDVISEFKQLYCQECLNKIPALASGKIKAAICQDCFVRKYQPKPEKDDDAYDKAVTPMWERVRAAVKQAGHKKCRISYSNYSFENDRPVDNLDEIAIKGKVVLAYEASGSKNSEDYNSEIMENPTWLQVSVCANKMMSVTKCSDHCFLEGVRFVRNAPELGEEINVYTFSMGS